MNNLADTLIQEFIKALEAEILFLKEWGGDRKFVCKNGVYIRAGGGHYIYEFIVDKPVALDEDTPIAIKRGSENVKGTIAVVEGLKVTLALSQHIGERVAEVIVVANTHYLYEVMQQRLRDFLEGKGGSKNELALKTFGMVEPLFSQDEFVVSAAYADIVNVEQREAITRTLANEVTFIWGPPGTGKTQALAVLVAELLARGKSVLIASHTNIAIDNALDRISTICRDAESGEVKHTMVRLGTPQLTTLLKTHPELDLQYWVTKEKGDLAAEELALQTKIIELVRSVEIYNSLTFVFDRIDAQKREIEKLEQQERGITGRVQEHNEKFLELNAALSGLRVELQKAEAKNALVRFFTGTRIEKIRERISTAQIATVRCTAETKALETQKFEIPKRIEVERSSIVDEEREIENLHHRLGKEVSGQEAKEILQSLQVTVQEAQRRIAEINEKLSDIEDHIIKNARVIGTTLTKVYTDKRVLGRTFDVVVVDEASTASMPTLFLAYALANERVVTIGDFRQLGPICRSKELIAQKWLKRDIFSQAGITSRVDKGENDQRLVQLREQRRMPADIASLVNDAMYAGQLRNGPKSEPEQLAESETTAASPFPGQHIVICDTSAVNPWSARRVGGSPFNVYDAFLAVELARRFSEAGITDIGLITPYAAQSKLIHELVAEAKDVTADPSSVHRFQGREKQVIIFDLVEGPVRRIQWLNGGRGTDAAQLINVAVTRAKAKLIFIANLAYLEKKLEPESVLRMILDKAKETALIVDSQELFTFASAESRVAVGGKVELSESPQRPMIYNETFFYEQFRHDISNAQESIIIVSPFITANRTTQFGELFREVIRKGVKMCVVTRPPLDQGTQTGDSLVGEVVQELKKLGVVLDFKKDLHEKLAIIDHRIIWYGSLNILSHKNTTELMSRFIAGPILTKAILAMCGINVERVERDNMLVERIQGLNELGVGQCPAGHKMIIKSGSNGVFLSCSQYPSCKSARPVNEDILVALYGEDFIKCEKCGKKMTVKFNPKDKNNFLGCSGYPSCNFTRRL